VVIPASIMELLREHAREALPAEACGVLLVRDCTAERYVRGRNRLDSPFRYELEIDPEVWFMEDEGYELAVFHSHPESEPRPSKTDIANIGLWEGKPYLIMRADSGELRGWSIDGGEVVPLELVAEPE
jgi:proteasome lid subunit RPN8/RPN11